MTPEQAMERINIVLAHAWMVRNFLKHAEEVEDNDEMLDVHRTIFDFIRSTEPSYQRGNAKEYLRRVRGKLPKLRRAAEFFSREHANISPHTNFQMAALSLSGCVAHITEVLAQVTAGEPESRGAGEQENEEAIPEAEGEEPETRAEIGE